MVSVRQHFLFWIYYIVEHVAICKESLVVKPTKPLVKPSKSPIFKESSAVKPSKNLMRPTKTLVVKPSKSFVNPTKSILKPNKTLVKSTETLVKPIISPHDKLIKIESENLFKNALTIKKTLNFEDIILRSVINVEISKRISKEYSTPSVEEDNMKITENNENPNKEFNEQKVDGEDQDIEKPHLCLNCHQSFSTFFEKALGHLCRK